MRFLVIFVTKLMGMSQRNTKVVAIIALVMGASLMRLIPNTNGFVPVTAATLFAAAYIGKKGWAILLPIFSVWCSDLMLNNTIYSDLLEGFTWFTPGFAFQFASYAVISLVGFSLNQKPSTAKLMGFSLLSSLIFFVLTNFGVWTTGFYTQDATGLTECYLMGLPFLERSLVADVTFSIILFQGFAFAQKRFPSLN